MPRFVSVIILLCGRIGAGELTVTIDAGAHDRKDTPVWFQLPARYAEGQLNLSNGADYLEIQIDASGRACVVLDKLKANARREYKLEVASLRSHRMTAEFSKDNSNVGLGLPRRSPTLHYQGPPSNPPDGIEAVFKRGGYIHPVFTPSGVQITDDYPLKHKHHHGIWWAWTKTEFEGRAPDFWNMGGKKGRVDFRSFGTHKHPVHVNPEQFVRSGVVHASISSSHSYIDMSAQPEKAALHETWDLKLYNVHNGYHLFDLECTQECAGDAPLTLPKYHYGGLGFRGHAQWDGKDNCVFLTSEGMDRSNGNETTARWCHIGGKVDGKWAGIAILCHKDNFRAPQPVRLHPTEPFFCYAPQQGGDFKIEAGKPYVSKYRFVVYDGEADKALLERLYNDYVNPPTVTVK